MVGNGLCKWSAGLKVMNFQARTEPIRLFIFSFFTPIVKDELAVLQRRTSFELSAETRITFTFCWQLGFDITTHLKQIHKKTEHLYTPHRFENHLPF